MDNAHEFRLTTWHNDPLSDSSGETFYIRDEDSGVFEDDDYLGKLTVKSSHADPNGKERDHTFRRDDAEYRLTYRVFAAPSKSERRTLRIKKLATTSTETE